MNGATREDVLRFFTRRAVEDLKAAAIGIVERAELMQVTADEVADEAADALADEDEALAGLLGQAYAEMARMRS